jgi:hypothetical protein
MAFVDDFFFATVAASYGFAVSALITSLVDNLQRVTMYAFGFQLVLDFLLQLITRLASSKRATRKAQQTYCQYELLHRSHSLVGLKEAGIGHPDALTL